MPASTSNRLWRVRVNAKIRQPAPPPGDCQTLAGMFGLNNPAPQILYENFELTIAPGQIIAVLGPSGAGKSVLLSQVAARHPSVIGLGVAQLAASDAPALAALQGGTLAARLAMLSRCGLAEARALLTPARNLSGGQLYRLALARAMYRASRRARPTLVVADEFAATLDDLTAQMLCRQIRRLVGQAGATKVSLLLATPRRELLPALAPDQVIVKPLGEKPRIGNRGPGFGIRETTTAFTTEIAEGTEDDKPESSQGQLGSGRVSNPECRIPNPALWPIERGTIHDYRALAQFHYLAGPPAAHKRVYVIRTTGFGTRESGFGNSDNSGSGGGDTKSGLWDLESGTWSPEPDRPALATSAPRRRADPASAFPKKTYASSVASVPTAVEAVVVSRIPNPETRTCLAGRQVPSLWAFDPAIAAVLVVSPPVLNVRGRNIATGNRYTGSDRAAAAARLNREVECISRVIVHPAYRGCGLAVRLVRHALAHARTPNVEALAAMGAVHPLFELAGMKAYRLQPDEISARLLRAARVAGLSPAQVAAVTPVERLLARDGRRAQFLRREIDACLARALRLRRGHRPGDPVAFICRLACRKYVYYLGSRDRAFGNRDSGREAMSEEG
jgi:ABC-type thiamine transport system ATPase subunit/GNAT superfamily N-acetyltransferase